MRPLIALALATLALHAPAATATTLPVPNVPDARRADAENGLTVAPPSGPFYATPDGEPLLTDVAVSYRDALDPLALGLVEVRVAASAWTAGSGLASTTPVELVLKSDGVPATVTVETRLDVTNPAWRPVPTHVAVAGITTAQQSAYAEATLNVVPRQLCAIVADGALPVHLPPPESGEWRLVGDVYVMNFGNGPVLATLHVQDAAGGTVTVLPAATTRVDAGLEASIAYEAVIPDARASDEFQWRAVVTAEPADAPLDGPPATCAGEDVVRVGDRRVPRSTYGAPGPSALAALAALALAARRRG